MWEKKKKLDNDIQRRLDDRRRMENQLGRLKPDENDMKVLPKRIEHVKLAIQDLQEERKAVITGFQAGLARDMEVQGLRTKTAEENIKRILEIDQIPTREEIERLENFCAKQGLSENDLEVYLGITGKKVSLELLKRAGIFFTLSEFPLDQKSVESDPDTQGRKNFSERIEARRRNKKVNKIYYRQPYPLCLSVYSTASLVVGPGVSKQSQLNAKGSGPKLTHVMDRSMKIMHPDSPPLYVTYSWAKSAQRTLLMEFDQSSQLMKLNQLKHSDLSEASATMAEAAKSAREEYSKTVTTVKDITTAKREIQLSELETQYQAALKRKMILDEQIQYEGISATKDLVLEKQIAEKEVEMLGQKLQAEQAAAKYDMALQQAVASGETDLLTQQLALEKAKQTNEMEVELAVLQAKVQFLEQQLLELQKLKAIKEANQQE